MPLLTSDARRARHDLLPRRRVAARERVSRAAPTTRRSRSGSPVTRTARSSSSKGCTATASAAGLGAIPTPWKVALAVLAVGRARARVVAEPPVRSARPARARAACPRAAEYVRALAVSLERTRDPGHALAPMQQWARAQRRATRAPPTRRLARGDRPRRDRARVLRSRNGPRSGIRRPTTTPRSRSAGWSRACRNTMGERRERAARSRRAGGSQGRRRPGRRGRGVARRR